MHRKDYSRRKLIDGNWTDVAVTLPEVEEAICKTIEAFGFEDGQTYSGGINLSLSAQEIAVILHGVKLTGQPASNEFLVEIQSAILFLEKCEAVALKDVTFEASAGGKKNYGGFSKGQTEAERLNDRWEFFRRHMSLYIADCKDMGEFNLLYLNLSETEKSAVDNTIQFLHYLLK